MSSTKYAKWFRVIVVVVVLVAVAAFFNRTFQKKSRSTQATSPTAMPVVTATAKRGDQPIYLTGLGSVTAYNTVTLRTRVDGELLRVVVHEGQMVSAGDLIAEIDPRPFLVQLTQAEGQSERDQALLANAKIDLERYKILYSQDSVPKQQLDTQQATVNQLEATLKSDQGLIDDAKLQLIYTRITSPINGRIGLRQIDPGNIVHATDQSGLAIITQLQPIAVIFNIPEDNIKQVMKKLQAGQQLRVDAYDRELKNKIATGYLLTIDNQVDVNTGTVRFKASFPNEDNALFPNQFVNARLLIDVKRRTVLIPSGAIQRGPQGTYVFVVKADDTVETRDVVVGPIEGDVASIDRGLSANEVVVTEGVDKLQPGTLVQPSQSERANEVKAVKR
jgi:membrane fusion protein, multidrug efflux system